MENGHKKKGSFAGMILVIVLAAVLLCFMPKIRSFLRERLHPGEESGWTQENGTYEVRNGNVPYFTDGDLQSAQPFQSFSELDAQGRCGVAFACLERSMMPDREREDLRDMYPSDWQQEEYPGIVEDGFLYNRCHLIAYQLTGENHNEKNIITGTRYLNVEGMFPFESEVASYLRLHPGNHVLYRVTPDFQGKELVARGVLMEAWSLEDDGALAFCVYCYNVQPGILIDYRDGESEKDPEWEGPAEIPQVTGGMNDERDLSCGRMLLGTAEVL